MKADNKKFRELTKWKQDINFREGIKKTIQWYKFHNQYFDKPQYNLRNLFKF